MYTYAYMYIYGERGGGRYPGTSSPHTLMGPSSPAHPEIVQSTESRNPEANRVPKPQKRTKKVFRQPSPETPKPVCGHTLRSVLVLRAVASTLFWGSKLTFERFTVDELNGFLGLSLPGLDTCKTWLPNRTGSKYQTRQGLVPLDW